MARTVLDERSELTLTDCRASQHFVAPSVHDPHFGNLCAFTLCVIRYFQQHEISPKGQSTSRRSSIYYRRKYLQVVRGPWQRVCQLENCRKNRERGTNNYRRGPHCPRVGWNQRRRGPRLLTLRRRAWQHCLQRVSTASRNRRARSRTIPTYLHRCSRSYECTYTCNAAVEARFPEYVWTKLLSVVPLFYQTVYAHTPALNSDRWVACSRSIFATCSIDRFRALPLYLHPILRRMTSRSSVWET